MQRQLVLISRTPSHKSASFCFQNHELPGEFTASALVFQKLEDLEKAYNKDSIGIALEIVGRGSFQYFFGEAGLHLFRNENDKERILVQTSGAHISCFNLDTELVNLNGFDQFDVKRLFDLNRARIVDRDKKFPVENDDWEAAVCRVLEASFRENLNRTIELWEE